ncbi:peptidase S41-like protein [Chitinophaga polysaccharea]|uniref:Peptidase S41-like protein n=1 Tax=Chitinophaga polysaccharea TaxID=1293035 RepID=A0A561PWJ2_9BACT|nr:S41 family peptidase [Chitinophaga polysaccharea]TWF42489.1 peptidase S41-like protein [Chitinophaga polysaccharea]
MYRELFTTGAKAMLAGVFCAGVLMSCHKDHNPAPDPGTGPVITDAMKEDSLRYLMYQIMQVTYGDGGRNASTGLPTYYWNKSVPVLNPFDKQFANADSLLEQMKRYAINPTTGKPFDRYSFLDRDGTLTNKLMNGVSSQAYIAATGSLGLDYAPVLVPNTNKVRLFVLYADKNSPAGQAGVTRGWEITSVNGTTDFNASSSSLDFVYNAILKSSSVTLTFKVPNVNDPVTRTINTASYNINPVLFDTIYTVISNHGPVKVGYFGMYTFASVFNEKGQPTATKIALDQTLSKFAAQGIRNLVVDLRYNGGGATTTAEYLDSAIAPASAAGKVMYKYKYNEALTQNLNAAGLASQVNFPANTGGFTLDNVFFIVSRGTASASELTLNNLKPYMNVRLVGDTTYGKPVGFIDFNISMYDNTHQPKYLADLYAINFETMNAKGEGGYFTGIGEDFGAFAHDFVNVPWGDTTDQNIKQALNYVRTGAYLSIPRNARLAAAPTSGGSLQIPIQNSHPAPNFNGMVDFRMRQKIR